MSDSSKKPESGTLLPLEDDLTQSTETKLISVHGLMAGTKTRRGEKERSRSDLSS